MTEKQVEDAVEAYFDQLPTTKNFSIQRQKRIPIGSRYGKADLVLCSHTPFQMFVIIECKKSGSTGQEGTEQLQSYLCATDTDLGIFATSGNPEEWDYYKNLGQNVFKPITYKMFIGSIRAKEDVIRLRQSRINERVDEQIEQEVKKRVSQTQIQARTEEYIQEAAKKRVTEEKIGVWVFGDLQRKIKQQAQEIRELKEVQNKQLGCAAFGWGLAILIIIALIWGQT